jgi:hypothetical protein
LDSKRRNFSKRFSCSIWWYFISKRI